MEAKPKVYYFFDVFTIANRKIYHPRYGEKPLKVPETFPIVKRMVDSYRTFKAVIINSSIGYKSLFERTTEPKSFTHEEEETINRQCIAIQNLTSPSPKYRKWFLANCLKV